MSFLLVACSTGGPTVPLPTPTPQAVAPSPLVLTLWHTWSGRSAQALDQLARRYEQSHPNVRIRLQAHPATSLIRDYSAGVADGSAPQMVMVLSRYLGDLAARGHVAPLSDDTTTLDDLLPGAVQGAQISGQLYGLPLSYDSLMLFYDRRKLNTPPATIQPLNVAPTATVPDDNQTWGLGYYLSAAVALPYLPVFDGKIYDNKRVVLNESGRAGTLRWLDWLQTMRSDPQVLATDDYSNVDAMVQSNRVPAVVDWAHRLQAYTQLWGADVVGLAPLPPPFDNAPAPKTFVLSDVICLNTVTTSEQRAAALDFMSFLISTSAQETLWSRGGQFPVNRKAHVEGIAQAAMTASEGGVAFPNTMSDEVAWPLLDEMVRSVLAGSATPAEAIQSADTGLRAAAAHP